MITLEQEIFDFIVADCKRYHNLDPLVDALLRNNKFRRSIQDISLPIDVKIKYTHPDTKRLSKIEQGDWIDVYADEDITIAQGEYKLVRLGFAMELPEGYEAYVAPRSSSFKNWHILFVNSISIIDESFRGDDDEWRVLVYMPDDMKFAESITIHRGDKIGQFRIMKHMPTINLIEVDKLGNANRGGIGSTGKR